MSEVTPYMFPVPFPRRAYPTPFLRLSDSGIVVLIVTAAAVSIPRRAYYTVEYAGFVPLDSEGNLTSSCPGLHHITP